MAVMMNGELFNGTGIRLKHEPSGKEIITVPPVDNGGEGSSFSPTDLCAASLGACAATTIALFAKRNQINLQAVTFSVQKDMNPSPRRLGKLTVHYKIKADCTPEAFQKLVTAGKACPVRASLSPDVEILENYERI